MLPALCTATDSPAARIEGYFERWFDKHPTHRPSPTVNIRRREYFDPATAKALALRLTRVPTPEIQRITPEQRAAVLALLPTGLLYKEIAERLGMNRSTIQKIANRSGAYRRGARTTGRSTYDHSEHRCRQVLELRSQGLKQREIAQALCLARTLVAYYLGKKCKAAHRLTTKTTAHLQTAA